MLHAFEAYNISIKMKTFYKKKKISYALNHGAYNPSR